MAGQESDMACAPSTGFQNSTREVRVESLRRQQLVTIYLDKKYTLKLPRLASNLVHILYIS